MHLLYSLLLGLVLLLTLPWWAVQALRHGKYRAGLAERLGRVPARLAHARGAIWVHAVSVGEVLAIAPVVEQLRPLFPARPVFISTTTQSGQKLARERFGEQHVFYFPLDFGFAIKPYLRALQPALVVVAETEFWPNFLRLACQSGARVAVVNARISDRSLPRYAAARGPLSRVLRNVHLFLAQSAQDASRLVSIGAAPERVRDTGNLKFDVSAPPARAIAAQLAAAAAGAPVLVCGSTVEGEEPEVLAAFQGLRSDYPDAVLVLAPRHPERFAGVASLAKESGVPTRLRSAWQGEALRGSVLLLDTIGELAAVYAAATVAFVGGSMAARGGHNILEPAQFAKPILVGPHMQNFRDIMEAFRSANAVRVVKDAAALAAAWRELLADETQRQTMGEAALRVLRLNQGATARTVGALAALLAAQGSTR